MNAEVKHNIVAHEPGVFFGWPANHGAWNWGDEIVVGILRGKYRKQEGEHSIERNTQPTLVQARSLDGGETWSLEAPDLKPDVESKSCPGGINFAHPDFALKITSGTDFGVTVLAERFFVSYDRAQTWEGPYRLPDFGLDVPLTARTDYLVGGESECLFFLSAVEPRVDASLTDRAFCARTTDGGKTMEFLSWMTHEPITVRSVMPSTVRVSDTVLVSALRRRLKTDCWIDAYHSQDNGATWEFLSKIADAEGTDKRNGNPPSLVRLADGRLCAMYGYRGAPLGMRAKISADEGKTWGEEIILRGDAATWDMGYPQSVVREDGKVVTIYYYNTEAREEQHIAATIWDPSGS